MKSSPKTVVDEILVVFAVGNVDEILKTVSDDNPYGLKWNNGNLSRQYLIKAIN